MTTAHRLHKFRLVAYFVTTVWPGDLRADSMDPYGSSRHRCPACYTGFIVGERVISRRSAAEETPGSWGPIESFIHWRCYWRVPAELRPALGSRKARYEPFDSYPFGPQW